MLLTDSDEGWAGVRRVKREVTSVFGVAGLRSLPAGGRPRGGVSTQGKQGGEAKAQPVRVRRLNRRKRAHCMLAASAWGTLHSKPAGTGAAEWKLL